MNALETCARLAALAAGLQTIELLRLRREDWIDWTILREDFKAPRLFDALLGSRGLTWLLRVRLVAALACLIHPHALLAAVLFASSLLVSGRWRGSYNGGSDSMLTLQLGALTAGLARPDWERGALWYITIQLCLSYVFAGIAKIRHAGWLKGRALSQMLADPQYGAPACVLRAAHHPASRFVAWGVLVFEICFPLALSSNSMAVGILTVGALFHLANAWVLGINLFFWIWVAAYPALWACAAT